MKLSTETINILKNFASINQNILLNGTTLRTISPQKTVTASVTVAENFDEFGIYDLGQFLAATSVFSDPDLDFSGNTLVIRQGKTSIRYLAADKSVLVLHPDKNIKFPGADVELTMTADILGMVMKTAGILKAPDLQIVGDGSKLILRVCDLKNSSTNSYNVDIGDTTETFTANLKIDNLKMIPQDYKVEVSSKRLSKWTATKGDMQLFVALESTSTF